MVRQTGVMCSPVIRSTDLISNIFTLPEVEDGRQ